MCISFISMAIKGALGRDDVAQQPQKADTSDTPDTPDTSQMHPLPPGSLQSHNPVDVWLQRLQTRIARSHRVSES